jgi:hypothetical protein
MRAILASIPASRDRAHHPRCARFAHHLRRCGKTQSNALSPRTAHPPRSLAAAFRVASDSSRNHIVLRSRHRYDRRSRDCQMQSTPKSPKGPHAPGGYNGPHPPLHDFAARRRRASCFSSAKSISPASPLSIPSRHAFCSQWSLSASARSKRSMRRNASCTTSLEEAYRPVATWASMNFASSSLNETLIFMNGLSLSPI